MAFILPLVTRFPRQWFLGKVFTPCKSWALEVVWNSLKRLLSSRYTDIPTYWQNLYFGIALFPHWQDTLTKCMSWPAPEDKRKRWSASFMAGSKTLRGIPPNDQCGLMDYTTRLGRYLLRTRWPSPWVVTIKWSIVLPANFTFNWSELWITKRARKEARPLWRVFHKALAVNLWRSKISPTIYCQCPLCDSGEDESIPHRFWTCYYS
jgi:hypothetical protein